ncbi:hypothetical protein, partial [Bradyrhizobium zhanjiangense]|uniref:hypothetical protein n=1 Tax=Bradyrhizobium zhanjiangense TaxID=1325107 RepID=UPI0019D6D803
SGNSPKSPSSAIILSSKSICLENHIRLTLDTEKSHSLVGWAKRSVPTNLFVQSGCMVGTALLRLCPPYGS